MADLEQVFILSTTFLLFLAYFVQTFANKFDSRPESHDYISRSDGQASRHTSNEGIQNTPPSRKTDPGSHTWDEEIIKAYAESVSGGNQTYLPSSHAPSIPSVQLMPSMPSSAITRCALAGDEEISMNSEEMGRMTCRVVNAGLT